MATIKLVILTRKKKKNGQCPIYLQISALSKMDWIYSGVDTLIDNWSGGVVTDSDKDHRRKNREIQTFFNVLDTKFKSIEKELCGLDAKKVKQRLLKSDEVKTDFIGYAERRILDYKASKRKASAVCLSTALAKVKAYWGKSTLEFNEINQRWLERFVTYCEDEGRKPNAIASYLRYIRVMFNDAIDDNYPIAYPFRKFKIKQKPTTNRNLSIEVIRQIRDYVPTNKRDVIARDIFMLQFMLLGINCKDLFYLTPSDLQGDRLVFSRFKTGKPCNIKVEPEALKIIESYRGEKYLLWFADHQVKQSGKAHARLSEFQYANEIAFTRMLNVNLKTIGNCHHD